MPFYIRLAFTSGLALRIKEATYFTKSTNSSGETHNIHIYTAIWSSDRIGSW
jgi:hypothetical protein